MAGWREDLRGGFRQLRVDAGFARVAVLTLALGIGANTAIFSVVDAVLFRPLPHPDAHRIVRAWAQQDNGEITDFSFRVVEYRALLEEPWPFQGVGAEFPVRLTVRDRDGVAVNVPARMAAAGFFDVFGVEAARGRLLTRDEVEAAEPVAVVSHDLWVRHLGADPGAVGGRLSVGDESFTIVGVLPSDFESPSGAADLYIPYTIGTERWIGRWLDLYGRLAPGADPELAAEELSALLRRVGESEERSSGWHATVESLRDWVVGPVETALWALLAAVGLVLLITCVNVANLTLARASTREAEMAVRRALGAGRGRLARQLLVEATVLAGTGALAGLVLAGIGVEALLAVAPPDLPRLEGVGIDGTVLTFTAGIAGLSALLVGLAPALGSVRSGPAAALRRSGRTSTGGRGLQRALSGLVVAEVALALVLLVGAGLTIQTLERLSRVDLGFRSAGVSAFRVAPPSSKYPEATDLLAYYDRLRRSLEALPGVDAVGFGSDVPLEGEGAVMNVTTAERTAAGLEPLAALQRRAAPGFFRALGIPFLEGRAIRDRDTDERGEVAVISASLARALFPGETEVAGRRIPAGFGSEPGDVVEIVGVVGDVHYQGVRRSPEPQYYQAHGQSTTRSMVAFVRSGREPGAVLEEARAAVRALDPDVPVFEARILRGVVEGATAGDRFTARLFGVFAALALALAVAGIYGVLSFMAARRRREIGLRVALGAETSEVSRLVVRRGMGLVGAGLALGILGAAAAARLLESLLFGVSPVEPVTYGAVIAVLGTVALVACWLPARRAAGVDPMTVLRED